MSKDSLDLKRVLRSAAWIWLAYLGALFALDALIYAGMPPLPVLTYTLRNVALALVFFGLAHWPRLDQKLRGFYAPLMLVILATLPIAAVRIGMVPLPPGPLSNVEGVTLRLLPVLFVGLVAAAWGYAWQGVVWYALGTAGLEIGLWLVSPSQPSPSAGHAVLFVTVIRTMSFLVVGYFISRLMARLKTQQAELAAANNSLSAANTNLAAAIRDLEGTNARLAVANARLIHHALTREQLAVSRERNRLARELHDTLAHTLSGLSVQLETTRAYWEVEPDTGLRLLTQALEATRAGLDETRLALKALRASPLEDLGLRLALRKLAESAAERGNLRLDLHLPAEIPPLDPALEQCLYRIAQEASENTVRHAQAQTLTLRLVIEGKAVCLSVEDDGVGFNPEQAGQTDHYGLAGIHERAQLVGGALRVESGPGQGTRVEIRRAGGAR